MAERTGLEKTFDLRGMKFFIIIADLVVHSIGAERCSSELSNRGPWACRVSESSEL